MKTLTALIEPAATFLTIASIIVVPIALGVLTVYALATSHL